MIPDYIWTNYSGNMTYAVAPRRSWIFYPRVHNGQQLWGRGLQWPAVLNTGDVYYFSKVVWLL